MSEPRTRPFATDGKTPRSAGASRARASRATTTPSRVYRFQPAIETMSRDALAALQLRRLRATLRRAYDHVAPYRAKCQACGVEPEDLRSLDDLALFPFSLKSDLRDTYPFGLFAVPRAEMVRLHASSGTTGRPTVVGYTQGDLAIWADLMARSLAAAGARPGDVVHNA